MSFQRISTEAIVKGMVRKDAAWRVISDFGNYPALMSNVDKVVVHERKEHHGKSEWFVTLDNAPLHWLEHDTFDAPRYGINFESIDGDFERISGSWKVEDGNGDGIRLEYSVDYRLGIPVIEEVVGDVLKQKMKKGIDSMMLAVKNELDKPARIEERAYSRSGINSYNTFLLNEREMRAHVINISRQGMMFVATALTDPGKALIAIDGVIVDAEVFSDPVFPRRMRAVFQKAIRQDELDTVVEYLTTKNVRSVSRILIQKDAVLKYGEKEISVHIVDISPGGMLIGRIDPSEIIDDAFEIEGVSLVPGNGKYDAVKKTLRIQYAQNLNEVDYTRLLARLESSNARPAVEMQMA
jgi:ribosome-associated toxin RatA of RatAB toxin-antitoxin module